MKRCVLIVISLLTAGSALFSQKKTVTPVAKPVSGVARPKLVVGIVIDQMRWDYLYRFNNLFKVNGGFKRFLNEGYTCENTFIPYTPTYTAAGHASVYTGSVPAINGVTGNNWYDNLLQKAVYCADDNTVSTVGSSTVAVGQMSPRNLLATTVTDELRVATNFNSKVIGIALKDRGAIMPAGHTANGAFWYDGKTGKFVTSTWYTSELPDWVQQFNDRKLPDSLYALNWNLSLPKEVYSQYCTDDIKNYEGRPFGKEAMSMPYTLSQYAGSDYEKLSSTPQGNTITAELAKTAVAAEHLGKDGNTDFLAVSFSSPDYIGHTFGPNSWEQLDDYIKLDETLGKFFDYLDAQVGKNQWTVFLTADHGVAHVPGFSKENNLPGGSFGETLVKDINEALKVKFGKNDIVKGRFNYQLVLNKGLVDSSDLNRDDVVEFIINYLMKQDGVANAFELSKLAQTTLTATIKDRITNGYYPTRCGDIQYILKPGYMDVGATGTTHGLWNPYDSHIPLLFYGWGIKHGSTNRETYMTDISATISALLHIQMPSGCVGHVIEEVMK
ncbi:Predicted pyrophosphatase or phosphodiesterase, AlkP superfamily [Filimonas lacunae]|uniref:Predicted pyrophosphatase or phosphodiesterase, AlkP superfamily n=1 Tax=Filimonas lacunae TaxID=477680 RepID=A0A173MKW2_9BACT|nr:alkaline phosphatase PafA [Filimonas lacunae]BAV08285.1 alkaline phosphatase [Filimonas lacunae]SIT33251.1 Predicted pyrophosphatase or phosphodiesterase, AlkP superfamily [Filimonas lacunae]